MKLIFITALLAILLFGIIISLDLLTGVTLQGIFWKALNPFRVMEPAEYIILFLFSLFFFLELIGGYLNKKKGNNPSSN